MEAATVAVLGAGALGAAMAARLGDTGHQVNRADGPLAMPYAQQKATAMDEHAYTAGFAVELARKDLAAVDYQRGRPE